MRMRKRHNLQPRMERCADYLIAEPENMRGSWRKPGRPLLLDSQPVKRLHNLNRLRERQFHMRARRA